MLCTKAEAVSLSIKPKLRNSKTNMDEKRRVIAAPNRYRRIKCWLGLHDFLELHYAYATRCLAEAQTKNKHDNA